MPSIGLSTRMKSGEEQTQPPPHNASQSVGVTEHTDKDGEFHSGKVSKGAAACSKNRKDLCD